MILQGFRSSIFGRSVFHRSVNRSIKSSTLTRDYPLNPRYQRSIPIALIVPNLPSLCAPERFGFITCRSSQPRKGFIYLLITQICWAALLWKLCHAISHPHAEHGNEINQPGWTTPLFRGDLYLPVSKTGSQTLIPALQHSPPGRACQKLLPQPTYV